MDAWNHKCHSTVGWSEIQTFLIGRSRGIKGNPEDFWFGLASPIWGMYYVLNKMFGHFIEGWLEEKGRQYAQRSAEQARRTERIRILQQGLFPFIDHAEIFNGPRYPWRRGHKRLSPSDLRAAGHFVITFIDQLTNLWGRVPTVSRTRGPVNLTGHIVVIGGPIPNWYTRNVMYGSDINLPYRFRLDVVPEYRDKSPYELREEMVKQGQRAPGWFIAAHDGSPATVFQKKAIPQSTNGEWVEDYFMIIKCRNIHPEAHSTSSLILCGCHGVGLEAAGIALTNMGILDKIYEKVEQSDFQALGWTKVRRGRPIRNTVSVDPSTIIKLT